MVKPEKFIPKAIEKISKEIRTVRQLLHSPAAWTVLSVLSWLTGNWDRLQPIYIDTGS